LQFGEGIADQLVEYVVLALVVREQRRLRYPDPLGDLAGGDILEAMLQKELFGCDEDLAEPLMTRAPRLPVGEREGIGPIGALGQTGS
jgi:hypothetical protein